MFITWCNNNLGALIAALIILLIFMSTLYLIVNFKKYNNYFIIIVIPILGCILGAVGGIVLPIMSNLDNLSRYVINGGGIGLLLSTIGAFLMVKTKNLKCAEIQLNIPQFSQIRFIVSNESRRVAWSLFIETITRISTQPLKPGEGYLSEAINSLYSLFKTTRELLKSMEPSEVQDRDLNCTVEMLAVSMVNNSLRPFLNKWHPLLQEFMKNNEGKSETDWEREPECRIELEKTRKEVVNYAKGFGQLAGVTNLSHFLNGLSDNKE